MFGRKGDTRLGFQLKQDKKESENKTIRFPAKLVKSIEDAILNQGVSFSSFVIQACEYALNNMDNKSDSNINKE